MQAYIERLQQARITLFEEASKKRPAPTDLVKAADSTKRQRTDQPPIAPPLGADVTISVAQLFTLTSDPGAQNFDVQSIPHETVAKLIVPLLRTVDKSQLDNAVNVSYS
jgi:symplekin